MDVYIVLSFSKSCKLDSKLFILCLTLYIYRYKIKIYNALLKLIVND